MLAANAMRHFLLVTCALAGCVGSSPGDDDMMPDVCPMPMTTSDAGALAATKAQMCNVTGSMGAAHWYRLAAPLPGSSTSYVQLELWDGLGAFTGGKVHTGTFTIAGADANRSTCGVCVRGIGDQGGSDATEYFAISGTVNVTAVGINGEPISAALSNISFVELDISSQKTVTDGCASALAAARIDGTVTQIGGSSGGGSGGGSGQCATGVGD